MKLVILGATGGTGLKIVSRAVDEGHAVTAFVRAPERLKAFAGRIHIRQGDLLDPIQLEEAIRGHDAVISGFGPRAPLAKADANLLECFGAGLTEAMRRAGVARVVVESVAFLFKDTILPPAYLLGRLFFPQVVADAAAMERIVAASGLDWTIVRPPRLTDKPFTGRYRTREGHLPQFGFAISRADVAEYMVKAAADSLSVRKIVGVCN